MNSSPAASPARWRKCLFTKLLLMGKLLFFLLFVSAITKAQEKYNWLDIEDVKFYDL
jgi:hypothetical protein